MAELILPNNWQPRDYQRPLWNFLENGGKRALVFAHRRWGKDDVLLHNAACQAMQRPATYWHCLPEYAQARKAIWDAVNPHTGKRRIDEAFPHAIRSKTRDDQMFIELVNGATWQVIGSDRYDSLVGSAVAGITFSEWAMCNPSAWSYISPMMRENNGWAAFITTPRGENWAHKMLVKNEGKPDWFTCISNVAETKAFTDEQLREILQTDYVGIHGEDVGRAMFEQEYYCSFTAAIVGAYYTTEMRKVRQEDRILSDLEYVEGTPVHTAWDLGMDDSTAIWWFQVVGSQIYVLDCYEASGQGVDHYISVIREKAREHGWHGGTDYIPHDGKVREFIAGRTRVEEMRDRGLDPKVVPSASFQDGVNAVRQTLRRAVFHQRCKKGIEALDKYRRKFDDVNKVLAKNALHDEHSHFADAFRYLSLSWREAQEYEHPKIYMPPSITKSPSTLGNVRAQPLKTARR